MLYPILLSTLLFGWKGNKWYEKQLRQNSYYCTKVYTFKNPGKRSSPSISVESLVELNSTEQEIEPKRTTNVWMPTDEHADEQTTTYSSETVPGSGIVQSKDVIQLGPESTQLTSDTLDSAPASKNGIGLFFLKPIVEFRKKYVDTIARRISVRTPNMLPKAATAFLIIAALLVTFFNLRQPDDTISPVADSGTNKETDAETTDIARFASRDRQDNDVTATDSAATESITAGDTAAGFDNDASREPGADANAPIDSVGDAGFESTGAVASENSLDFSTNIDIDGLFYGVTSTLHAISDTPSAEAAIPNLNYINAKAQDLVDVLISTPESSHTNLKASIDENMQRLRLAAESAASQPGVGTVIDSIVKTLAINFESIGTIVASRRQASSF